MSRFLTERSIDHVVIERGEVANTWKHERWDSMRLLTPNRQTRLHGYRYDGDDPDSFMTMPEVIAFIEAYSEFVSAPVEAGVTVTSVQRIDNGYRVTTDQGDWKCRTVVLASGGFNLPHVPAISKSVPASITMMTPKEYRNPDQLEDGGVLVVGAAATGIQLADEIHRSGRPVTLSVGEHVRLPRVYRGHDILWWMEVAGVLDERYDEVDDIVRARNVPSPQLVGSPGRVTVDLNALTDIGVKLIGQFAAINDGKGQFSGSLRNKCALADLKMHRLLDTIDEWATENGLDGEIEDPQRFPPTRVEDSPPLGINFNSGEIRSIVWATGSHPDYSWLNVPVFDRKGWVIRHNGGVVDSPGMYLLGLTFMRRRKSSFIHGAEDDTRDLCAHLASYLDRDRERTRED